MWHIASRGFAHLLRGGLASFDGVAETIQKELGEAETKLREAGLLSFQMAVAYRLAHLSPQPRETTAWSEIQSWVEREGIGEPERVARMLAPGSWDRRS